MDAQATTSSINDEITDLKTSGSEGPVCLIVLGMAGSGKTTFVQKLSEHLYTKSKPPYIINLDPAVKNVPYPANIDIRDTVNYKEVMKQYNLGPNGAILTSLNLFTTRFDQAINLLDKRRPEFKYFIFDTPGQIEVFTWSASGTILTEALASTFPTVIVYVMDIARSVSPATFMSNMLYACSILYKMKLPFVIVLNKADIISPKFAIDWMHDFEKFQDSLNEEESSYVNDLVRSLSLVLDEFYCNIKAVPFSSITGEGIEKFFESIQECSVEYEKEYKPEYERLKSQKEAAMVEEQAKQLAQVKIDLAEDEQQRKTMLDDVYKQKSASLTRQQIHLGGVEMEDEEDEMDLPQRQHSDDEDDETKAFDQYMKSTKKEVN